MSYTKQTWQAGDEITSAKLNHLENGISEASKLSFDIINPQNGDTLIYDATQQKWINGENSGINNNNNNNIFIVNSIYDQNNYPKLDKTAAEIIAAINSNKIVIVKVYEEDNDPQYGYTRTILAPIRRYEFYTPTGTYDGGESYEFVSDFATFLASELDDYPAMQD